MEVSTTPVLPVEAETPEAELERAFENGDLVVACWEPECTMHRLPHWADGQWVSRSRDESHASYSHGICMWHLRACQEQLEQLRSGDARSRRSAVFGT